MKLQIFYLERREKKLQHKQKSHSNRVAFCLKWELMDLNGEAEAGIPLK